MREKGNERMKSGKGDREGENERMKGRVHIQDDGALFNDSGTDVNGHMVVILQWGMIIE